MTRGASIVACLWLTPAAMADVCPDVAGTYHATSEAIALHGENKLISEGVFSTARWLLLGYGIKEAPAGRQLQVDSKDSVVLEFDTLRENLLIAAYGAKGTPKTVMASKQSGEFTCGDEVIEFRPWISKGSGDGGRFRTVETRRIHREVSGDLIVRLHQKRERSDLFVIHTSDETIGQFRFRRISPP